MNKKHLFFFLLIVVAIIGISITIKIAADLRKETKIRNEIKEISRVFLADNIDDDEVNEILERNLIEKGNYQEVELSIKNYYRDLYSDLKNLTFLLDDDNFANYLTGKNLNDDRPSFIKSKDNLQNTKAQIEQYFRKLKNELEDENTKLSYFKNNNKDSYYPKFYLELTTVAINEDFKKDIENKYNKVISNIDIYNEAFDFLIANKGHWAIKNEVIIFDDTLIYEEYVNITNKLNEEVSEN